MKVVFYGTGSAIPSRERGFACIGIHNKDENVHLLDCGDGSIHRLIKYRLDVNKISNVLLSHYHSDHVTGLTSIIETMVIRRRASDLTVFGPIGLKEYFSAVQKTTNVAYNKKFQINLVEISAGQKIKVDDSSVSTFKMDHTLPCVAYRIENGNAVVSYTGDTQPCPDLLPLANDADLLIHEATYLQRDLEKARLSKHCTPGEAAKTALDSKAKSLVMTHVNDSCETPEEMLSESRGLRNASRVAVDGLEIEL